MKKLFKVMLALIMFLSVAGCGNKETSSDQNDQVVFDESKTYNDTKTYESGIIKIDNVVLENATFKHDLIIDSAVLEGDVTLKNINIGGKLIVNGGGKNSIHLEGSQINEIISDKKGSPVRIVTDETSTVGNIAVDGETLLEINCTVSTISVSQTGEGSNIQLSAGAVVNSVDVNASVELNVNTPLKTLSLNAKSSVNLNSTIDNVTLSKEANDTKVIIGDQGVVDQMKTETTVEISGNGKLNNVVTDNQENITGDIKAKNVEVKENPLETPTPTIAPSATPESTATPKPTPKPTIKPTPSVEPSAVPTAAPSVPPSTPIVETKEQLENAIANKVGSIQIKGTIGSEEEYTVYTIKHEMKIQGIKGSKVYGSFIVDADNVSIDGLEIHNQGWMTGDPVDARRNAISIVSNRVSITNNVLVSSTILNGKATISNGIVIQAGTNTNTNINISKNTINGYKYDNNDWSSTGILFVSNSKFPFETTNSKGSTNSVGLTLDFSYIAKDNTYKSCYNDLIYADYSNPSNPYKYTYSSTNYGTISGLIYADPTSSKIELAPGQYEFAKKDTHTNSGLNKFVIKENSELIVPSTAQVTIASDTELVISVGGKLTGVVEGNVNDLDARPTISNALLEYEAGSENIIVSFDIDLGFELTIPSLMPEELVGAYSNLLLGDEKEALAAAKKVGNDVILFYYYLNEDGTKMQLSTINGRPIIKNKFWDGYLNYYEGNDIVNLKGSGIVEGTSLGARIPKGKSWITSVNPRTGTVNSGWLDDALGKKVCVDIVVVYNGKIVKETVAVDVPNKTIPVSIIENEIILDENISEKTEDTEALEQKNDKENELKDEKELNNEEEVNVDKELNDENVDINE